MAPVLSIIPCHHCNEVAEVQETANPVARIYNGVVPRLRWDGTPVHSLLAINAGVHIGHFDPELTER